MKETRKTCPLRCASRGGCFCEEERCAWWDKIYNRCSVLSINWFLNGADDSLSRIAENVEDISIVLEGDADDVPAVFDASTDPQQRN